MKIPTILVALPLAAASCQQNIPDSMTTHQASTVLMEIQMTHQGLMGDLAMTPINAWENRREIHEKLKETNHAEEKLIQQWLAGQR